MRILRASRRSTAQLNAFITVTAELAPRKRAAREAEIAQGNYRGPLHGIPFGLKDIYRDARRS